jgi:hypothetical protein
MDVMFKSKEEPEPTPFGPGPDVDQDEEGNEDGEKGDEEPEPKPERKALHERILRTFLFPVDETPLDRMPVAVLVLGGPCSSRSAVVKNLAREGRFVRVDPEAIGSLCPEYEEAIQKTARNAPSIVKEEAGFISRRLIEKATEDRKNLAIEAIGQDPPECYDLLNSLEDLGYYTIVILMDADRSTIIDRNKFRGSRCGRWVQREAFSLGKVAALTFEKLKAKKKAQEFIRLDVRGEAPKIVRSVLEELDELVEDESDEPDKPSISYKKIRTLAFEGIQREVANTKALPEKYKPSEGPLLDHYDDFHIRAVDVEEEEEEVEP